MFLLGPDMRSCSARPAPIELQIEVEGAIDSGISADWVTTAGTIALGSGPPAEPVDPSRYIR